MQGRWLVGLLFGVVFLACFVVFMVYALGMIAGLYRFAAGFFSEPPPETPVGGAAAAFAAAMLVYGLSLLDTYMAYLRRRSRYAQWRADRIVSQ